MTTFKIEQGISIGPAKLGMKREELRKILNEPFTEIAPEEVEEDGETFEFPPADYFETSSIKAEYDTEDNVVFLEIGPLTEVTWNDLTIFETSCKALFEHIHKADSSAELDEAGIYAYEIGLAAYAPHYNDDPEQPTELISVFPATK